MRHVPAPEKKSKYNFRFIDLFAGIGGLRLGFEAAGGKCIFTSEIDKFAQQTYKKVFGSNHPIEGDITKVPVNAIPEHEVLLAGFPCQPFSLAGVSKYNSLGIGHGFEHATKGTLFFHIKEILKNCSPEAFFLENVKNLKSHDHGNTWKVIKNTLLDLGYEVYAEIFDAKLLLPQHRERIFIVGFLKELGVEFEFPTIEDRHPTLRDILDSNLSEKEVRKYTLSDNLWQYLQDYAAKHKSKGNGFGYGIAPLDGVTRTLSARYYKDGSEILIEQRGKNPRRLTPTECAKLQGFPEDYYNLVPDVVSEVQAYKQFGNAVAVPLVKILAREVIESLSKCKKSKVEEVTPCS